MRDVREWLERLGLGKYATALAENEIDFDALPHVTDEDLKAIGMALGARRKLLAAIPELESDLKSRPRPLQGEGRPVAPEAERRQLTVMFCDLARSTELSQKLDPEELRSVLRAYQECCSAIIARYDGYIAKYIGDGLLVYFGYPQAHEDDAQRAAHAGVEIAASVAELSGRIGGPLDIELAVHIGIHTGLVVVGEMGAGETREAMAIVGETPNIAARLEALAGPGTVLISGSTHSLIEGLFVCESLGAKTLKGIAKPVAVYRVTGQTDARSRFEAAARRGLKPMVGREQEMALLLDRWEQAGDGEGQIVLLSGEAGIGKSRIVRMLRDHTTAADQVWLRYQCSPYHTNSALHPVIDQIKRAAGFDPDDLPAVRLKKLQSLLARSSADSPTAVALMAALLSIPLQDRLPGLEMNPEQQKERTLAALVEQMKGLAGRAPLLIVFEDVHWIDPTSLELLGLLVDHVQATKALLLITHRPVFAAPWGGHPHVTTLTLNRLGRRQSRTMVGALTADKPLPDEVMDQILARTDGVPLFVEELTRTVLEAGILKEESERYVLAGPLPPLAIPATLHDSLMARLDRLPTIKEVAQTAAVIGREFSHRLLSEVSSARPAELEDALARLAEAELVFRRGVPPHATYAFKHALVRDAAYESLLRSKRHELHGRIARTLEQSFPEIAEAQPELLAYHLTEAGEAEPAIAYWKRAGTRAIERSANVEAVSHLRRGLELFLALPDWSERPQDELSLQAPLGSALTSARGYAAPETGEALARARALCRALGDPPQTFQVLYGLWNFFFVAGDVPRSYELAEEYLGLLQHDAERTHRVAAHSAVGQTLAMLGRADLAQDHLERSLGFYSPAEDRALCFIFGEDPALTALSFLCWALWFRGLAAQALARSEEAVERSRALSHPLTQSTAYAFKVGLHYFRREPIVAQTIAETGIAFCDEHRLPVFREFMSTVRGWALAEQGHPEEGLEAIRRGTEQWRATGTGLMLPAFDGMQAEAYARLGRFDDGLRILDEALDRTRVTGERLFEPELHRLKGILLLARSGSNEVEAEARFRKAIEVAREQGAKSLELRATVSLARLLHRQDMRQAAHDMLAAVLGGFTEGFDAPDLIEARAVLGVA